MTSRTAIAQPKPLDGNRPAVCFVAWASAHASTMDNARNEFQPCELKTESIMDANQSVPANPGVQPDLGAELISCRRLSGPRTLQAQGYRLAWLFHYVLYPLFMLPYIALMTSMIPFLVLGYRNQELMHPAFGLLFLSVYVAFWWFSYVWPRRDYMVLHENGLRIRLGFKRLQALFESIQNVSVGRAVSKVEGGIRKAIGFLNPGQADWFNQLDGSAIAFVSKDGNIRVFKALLTCFEPADLERFFEALVNRNPHLGKSDVASISESKEGNVT